MELQKSTKSSIIKVAGHWELEWNTPIKEAELWNLLLRDFEIADWFMWPVSGIKHNESSTVNLHERDSLADILKDPLVKGLKRVYFEPYNPAQQKEMGIDLRDFEHPKDVLYIFGSAHFNPIPGNKTDEDIIVQVPTVQNKGVLWPSQCLAVCLYDRLTKNMKGKKIDFSANF
jgi:hypothetical protein